jgi:hypothetical protein
VDAIVPVIVFQPVLLPENLHRIIAVIRKCSLREQARFVLRENSKHGPVT